MSLTQREVAEHLSLSQPSVSDWLTRLGLTLDAGLDAIRLAYIQALRASASTQTPSAERDAFFRTRRELAELKLARERSTLIDAEATKKRALQVGRRGRDAVLHIRFRLDPLLAGEPDPARRAELWDCELRQICDEIARGVEAAFEADLE